MDNERKGLRVSFEFFQKNCSPDEGVHEKDATVEEMSDVWKIGAMDGVPPFAMSCNFF